MNSDDFVINYGAGTVTLSEYFNEEVSSFYYPEIIKSTDDGKKFFITTDLESKGITVIGTENADTFKPTEYKETFVVAGGNDEFDSD